jgi:hypothetical protein
MSDQVVTRCAFTEPMALGMALQRIEAKLELLNRKLERVLAAVPHLSEEDKAAFRAEIARLEALSQPTTPQGA